MSGRSQFDKERVVQGSSDAVMAALPQLLVSDYIGCWGVEDGDLEEKINIGSVGNTTNTETRIPAAPLFKNGCGFFGTPAKKGLCSKSYAAADMEKPSLETDLRIKIRSSAFVWPVVKSTKNSARDASPSSSSHASSRCRSCRKKVGRVAFDCRCGYAFCVAHRKLEAHDCTFDLRATGRVEIFKANPLVKPDKIQIF